MTMSMRGELSMRATGELSTRRHEESVSNLSVAAFALMLILLAVASVIFAPAPSDPIPLDAEWHMGL
jgi:hypothetical protein